MCALVVWILFRQVYPFPTGSLSRPGHICNRFYGYLKQRIRSFSAWNEENMWWSLCSENEVQFRSLSVELWPDGLFRKFPVGIFGNSEGHGHQVPGMVWLSNLAHILIKIRATLSESCALIAFVVFPQYGKIVQVPQSGHQATRACAGPVFLMTYRLETWQYDTWVSERSISEILTASDVIFFRHVRSTVISDKWRHMTSLM